MAVALALLYFQDTDPEQTSAPVSYNGSPLALRVGSLGLAQEIRIEPNPLVELDGKSQAEVKAIRQTYLETQPQLFDSQNYGSSQIVFGQIYDSAAWWGIDGIYLHGPGELAATGPSEESRWIVNPFVLIGIEENHAFSGGRVQTGRWEPALQGVDWEPAQGRFVVRYDLSNYFARKYWERHKTHGLSLTSKNAQDFDMHYIYLVAEESKGVTLSGAASQVSELRQYLHRGGSCGYPGGCNNGSPATPELDFEVTELPAKIIGRLWAKKPASPIEPADLQFEIQLGASMSEQLPLLYISALCDSSARLRTCFDSTLRQCEDTARAAVESCMGNYQGGVIPNVNADWYQALALCIVTQLEAAPPGPALEERAECRD
jgi:hypothetical protein